MTPPKNGGVRQSVGVLVCFWSDAEDAGRTPSQGRIALILHTLHCDH